MKRVYKELIVFECIKTLGWKAQIFQSMIKRQSENILQRVTEKSKSDSLQKTMESEHNLGENAQWKEIQQNTFTRWANEQLKTIGSSIDNLATDLSDGLRLIALIEVLTQKRLPSHNARPTFRVQKLENVALALRFLHEEEGIKTVNIDASNIVDSNLKLIMGLIWTLILHYSISMPVWNDEQDQQPVESGQTPKQRLLAWVQTKIPNISIINFTKDWTTGKPVGALVDACAPGLCPDWEFWDPQNSVQNATEAMTLADDWLDVRQLIKPEELVDPNVDEQSMMTYLAQYPNCKLKDGAPLRPKADPNSYFPVIEETIVASIDPVTESIPAVVYPGFVSTPAEVYPGVEATPAEVHPGTQPPGSVVGEPAIITMETLPIDEADHFTEIAQLSEGSTFLFTGLIGLNCNGFAINFVYGNKTRDIALHINPRFPVQQIVTNTKILNSWGREEVPTALPFMLGNGERFHIQVLVTQTCYLIAVNGNHLTQYSHRISFEAVRFIEVKGNVAEVGIHGSMVRGYPQSSLELAAKSPSHVYFDVLPMYYIGDKVAEVGQLSEGDSLNFSGIIAKNCKEFEINFMCTNGTNDFAFHMKSRFSQKRIVRNSQVRGVWGHEEISTPPPYRPGDRFSIQVLVTASCYLISINGYHFTQYSHRVPFDAVSVLEVKGNVEGVQIHRSAVRGYPQHTLKRQTL